MELVAFDTPDGLRTDGLFVSPQPDRPIVVHVHGKCGNFYQNDFIKPMLQLFAHAGIGFLTFNHRGHDCIAEAYRDGAVEYVGGSTERFEDCLLDIDGALAFARTYSDGIVLQGHSNGSEKALFYALNRPHALRGLVLISPSDSYEMQRRYRPHEIPSTQAARLAAMAPAAHPWQLLAPDEYGIRSGDKDYPIPVTAESLQRLIDGPGFSVLRLDVPWPQQVVVTPTLICLGEHDPYLTVAPPEMARAVAERVGPNVTLEVVAGTDHHFHEQEGELVERIIDWSTALPDRRIPATSTPRT